ncbi:hypothetical protein SAMN05880590_10714 [Rhizobium sp. RU35A]|uniref:DUF5681 domain-containing protein n=1 Tax=Rhizobium sp. RU35A TaxID=1907414 RepID=UPI0009571C57|nr:DUF5681 domain-containing protein [Rhizobium sp. RU35A]SIQ75428.1 hypothetical protein SAMN05880590_10714 [Rhizobium sp. RU35A]
MADVSQPDWMQGFEAKPAKWTPGMKSPNPKGRPKGIVDKRQKLQAAFADEAADIARVVIDKALEGDMQAANIALARIAPPLRAAAERVQFELAPERPLSEQATQILLAVADGKVDPETGKTLIACLQAVSGIKATEDLEQRIIILEAKQA